MQDVMGLTQTLAICHLYFKLLENIMNHKEFLKALGKVSAGVALPGTAAEEFGEIIEHMASLLDEADGDDYFGTEGWTRVVFGD